VCVANRRTHKGSSAQLTTIGLDTSYIRNAVQTYTLSKACNNSLIHPQRQKAFSYSKDIFQVAQVTITYQTSRAARAYLLRTARRRQLDGLKLAYPYTMSSWCSFMSRTKLDDIYNGCQKYGERFICGRWRNSALVKCEETAQEIWYSAINDAELLRRAKFHTR
jgi:hypothetical protein